MTDDTIHPVLTPDEWAAHHRYRGWPLLQISYNTGPNSLVIVNETGSMQITDVNGLAALIALANAALPDDDPRKFTREDVALVDAANDFWPDTDEFKKWNRLAAKLAAYLPPETPK